MKAEKTVTVDGMFDRIPQTIKMINSGHINKAKGDLCSNLATS